MNERKLRRFCTAMILFAMLTRLLGGVGAGRFAFSEDSAEAETRVWPVRLLAAKPADEPSDEIAELPVENSAPPERQIAAEVTKLPEAFPPPRRTPSRLPGPAAMRWTRPRCSRVPPR